MFFRKLELIFIFFVIQMIGLEGRDPFFLEKENSKPFCGGKRESIVFELVGMIESGKEFGGILHAGTKSQVVFLGDSVEGYVVKFIDRQRIILSKNDQTICLHCK